MVINKNIIARLKELEALHIGSSEIDVREDFIKPLLELLGYKSGTENNIEREVSFKVPLRDNDKKLMRVDYILSVANKRIWVLEAKNINESVLDEKHIDQARSYTFPKENSHIKLYALCNGQEFALYSSENCLHQRILHVNRSELIEKWEELYNKLSVEAFKYPNRSDEEIILQITVDERFEVNYCPCHPKHFIGREEIRESFWNFIHNVKDKKSSKRVIVFEGISGMGKSSLILKLEEDCKVKYRDNVFFYQVDVLTINEDSYSFVDYAVKKAIQEAIKIGFIDLYHDIVEFRDIVNNSPFLNQSVFRSILKLLSANNKTIIIFFDRFEYVLSKPHLLHLYKKFEKFIYEVSYLQENLVLGFSVRTDILLDENIRYSWENLIDKRELFSIKEFLPKESQQYMNLFKLYLKQRNSKIINKKVEAWLLEGCAGFPWLLRKLCANIYTDSQSRLNKYQEISHMEMSKLVTDILKNDLVSLSRREYFCLEKIARLEIDDSLLESYDKEIKRLIDKKFVIEYYYGYIVSTDILRDYILNKEVHLPKFSITYIPKHPVSICLEVFRMLKNVHTKPELIKKLIESGRIKKLEHYNNFSKRKTRTSVDNIISDIRNFLKVEYDQKNKTFSFSEDLLKLDDAGIANYLDTTFRQHLVIQKLHEEFKYESSFYRSQFSVFLEKIYSEESLGKKYENNETSRINPDEQLRNKYDDYSSRLLSWFCFAGLIEKIEIKPKPVFVIPYERPGRQKGKISDSEDEDYVQLGLW